MRKPKHLAMLDHCSLTAMQAAVIGGGHRPVLYLDFLTEILDSRITFSRGSSATRVNSSGLIETVGSNVARFDYDPVTLAAKGLLIEEARTNYTTHSADFSSTRWTLRTGVTVTADVEVAPDGTTTADRVEGATGALVWTGAGTANRNTAALSSSTAYTTSLYLKSAGAASTVSVGLRDDSTGTITTLVVNLTSEWQRVSITKTTGAATTQQSVMLGASDGDFYAWGWQHEAGAFATSYIPTTASTATRSADVATMTGTNFSAWFNAAEGSFVVGASTTATSARAVTVSAGALANQLWVQAGPTAEATLQVYTSSAFVVQIGILPSNAIKKIAAAYKANDFAASINASAVATDTSGALASYDRINIGSNYNGSGGFLNGHLRSLSYYNTRLPNSTLQALTA